MRSATGDLAAFFKLAEGLRELVDASPEWEAAVDRLAGWLARLDEDED